MYPKGKPSQILRCGFFPLGRYPPSPLCRKLLHSNVVMRPQLEVSVIIKFAFCALQGYVSHRNSRYDWLSHFLHIGGWSFAFYVLFVCLPYFMQMEKSGFWYFPTLSNFCHALALVADFALPESQADCTNCTHWRTQDIYFWIWTLTQTVKSQKR